MCLSVRKFQRYALVYYHENQKVSEYLRSLLRVGLRFLPRNSRLRRRRRVETGRRLALLLNLVMSVVLLLEPLLAFPAGSKGRLDVFDSLPFLHICRTAHSVETLLRQLKSVSFLKGFCVRVPRHVRQVGRERISFERKPVVRKGVVRLKSAARDVLEIRRHTG